MRVEIAQLHSRLQITTIYVTHDQIEAMTLADRIVVLNNGRVEQIGQPLELYGNPANLFVAGFIGSPRINLLPARVSRIEADNAILELESGLEIGFTRPDEPLSKGQHLTVGVRPEHLYRSDTGGGLEVNVDYSENLGSVSFVHGETDTGERVIMENREQPLSDKRKIRLSFFPEKAFLFDDGGRRVR